MTERRPIADEFWKLLDAACADELTDRQWAELESFLEENPDARQAYIEHIRLRTQIRQWWKGERSRKAGLLEIEADLSEPLPMIAVAPLSSLPSPLSSLGGLVFSYTMSAVILGVAMLGAWAYKISRDYKNFASTQSSDVQNNTPPAPQYVGRITGMMDCRWADPDTETFLGASVPLDRGYALSAGLMEITYGTGAKVLLQGPCTYRVKSPNSGFLEMGKLTARIGEREKHSVNQQSTIKNHQSPSPLFTVRTPTAIVTDLGTEFGVEVEKSGTTTSSVLCGSVRIQLTESAVFAHGKGPHDAVLHEHESARIEIVAANRALRLKRLSDADRLPTFIQQINRQARAIDLLDVVAGGDGIGNRREHGVNPINGLYEPLYVGCRYAGEGQYASINWSRLIDGVFVPDGRRGPVQLDSAGHVFGGFPETADATYGSIWSRAANVDPKDRMTDHWIYAVGRCGQFAPDGRGLLGLCSNTGITFNLETVREMHRGIRPIRFRAVAGLVDARFRYPDADGMADVWVFVDGRLKFKRMHVRPQDGAVKIDVELGPSDRFLTLVTTDGGNGDACDWVVLGDPVLETETILGSRKEAQSMKQ
jgi:hypothetical protein